MKILAIETSCDETSVALVDTKTLDVTMRTASQIEVHTETGGIVPEVAAREHVPVIIPLIQTVLDMANVKPAALDRIAVTSGPGLMTSLMVGLETARTLASVWQKPLFGINHIEGHLAANFLEQPLDTITFPAIGLVVSGGHTELLYMPEPGVYELIGATRDDAAGECFDKCARILGLGYPGGPDISRLAATGDPTVHEFPRPMLESSDFDFSFSGLKTSVLYFNNKHPESKLEDVCAGIETAIVDVLVGKTKRAVEQYQAQSVLVGGGVAANQLLREQLQNSIHEGMGVPVYIPRMEYCTDNAAMIGAACMLHEEPSELFAVQANPNWELTPR